MESLNVQGRRLSEPELQSLRQWMGEHPEWSRWRLSRELATQWDWRSAAGQLKDMAARTLLLKLHQRGHIELPPRRQAPTNRMRCALGQQIREEQPIDCCLGELGPLRVSEVSTEALGRRWVASALGQFHYLGFGGPVGENLQYVISDQQERRLACLVFGAAAWKCQDRDQFIGWSARQRERNLGCIANNTRFLILRWVRVVHLASWALGQVSRRLSADWQAKYGHGLALVETFVERERFRATAYRAANWVAVGTSTGRTRQDRFTSLQTPLKDIYLYPLRRDFREVLRA